MSNDDSLEKRGEMNEELDKEKLIAEEVNKTIRSLDMEPNLRTDWGFHARLLERLSKEDKSKRAFIKRLFENPRLAQAFLLVIILANLATALIVLHDSQSKKYYREQYIESWAEQYLPDDINPLSAIDNND